MADVEKQQHHNHHLDGASLGAGPGRQAIYQVNPTFRTLGNPAPLGLMSFASTTLILSLVNVNARGVTHPEIVVGMALFVGGLCQLLAGMWEFACGNTFGATAFSSYGGFWLSYATIFIPGSNILAAYTNDVELGHAIGFYLAAWFIFTFFMLVAALRSNVALIALFFMLTLTFLLLMIGQFITKVAIVHAGGYCGIITAFIAYYAGISHMLTPDAAFFSLPLAHIPKGQKAQA